MKWAFRLAPESRKARLAPWVALLFLALALAAIHGLLNQRVSPFQWRDFLKHAGLVIGLQGVVLAATFAVGGLAILAGLHRVTPRLVAAVGLTLIVVSLLSLYVADYFANVYMRSDLTSTVVSEAINARSEFTRDAPIVATSVVVAWLLVTMLSGLLAFSMAGPISALPRTLFRPAAFACLIMFGAVGAYAWQDLVRKPGSWANDSLGRLTIDVPRPDITVTGGAPPRAPADAPDVIVILSDSLRADRLPQYGYGRDTTPFLTRLASSGHLSTIDYATSTCPRTACGVPSVLLSTPLSLAMGHRSTALHLYLRNAGYTVDFLLSGGHLADPVEQATIGNTEAFATFVDATRTGRGNDDEQVLDGLDRLPRRGREPHLVFMHLMSTHVAGKRLPAFRRHLPEESMIASIRRFSGSPVGRSPLSSSEQEALTNWYDNGVLQMDDFVRRIFDALAAKGYLDNAVLFISSDHGEALGEHGRFSHGADLLPENLRVPLLIYDTSRRPHPADRFASITDIAATAVARAGLPIPTSWDGIDMLGDRVREWSFAENDGGGDASCHGIYRRTRVALYYLLSCSGGTEWLFDLTSDPLGKVNILSSASTDLMAEMRQRLKERYPAHGSDLRKAP